MSARHNVPARARLDGDGWTVGRISMASEMWKEGASATEISRAIGGGLSRNAVIGKLSRLKLLGGERSARTVAAKHKPANRSGGTRAQLAAVRPQKPLQFGKGFETEGPSEAALDALRGSAWSALPGSTPVKVEKHQNDQCRWPIGDPLEPGFGFCGCAAEEGKPYCRQHASRARSRLNDPVPRRTTPTSFKGLTIPQRVIATEEVA